MQGVGEQEHNPSTDCETAYDVFVDIPNHITNAHVSMNNAPHPLVMQQETYMRHPFVLKLGHTLELCTNHTEQTGEGQRATLHLGRETHVHLELKATATGLHVHVSNDPEKLVEVGDIMLHQPLILNIPDYGKIEVHCEKHATSVLDTLMMELNSVDKSAWDKPEDIQELEPKELDIPLEELGTGDDLSVSDILEMVNLKDVTKQDAQEVMNYLESVKSSMKAVNVLDGQNRDYVTPCNNLARSNTSLRMYHDARTTGEEAKVHGEGAYYDIYNTINNAKKHIFISGWSLNVDMRLNRDVDESLGQLLIRKSLEDGVTVCVLLWRSSAEGNLITDTFSGLEKKADVGGTRNFSAYRFFENTLVQIKLWGANPLSKHIFTIYGKTMHQKFIICDTDNGNDSMAYIGGLDLSFGRYDTPEHPLFPEDNSDFMKYAFNKQLPDKDQNTFYGNVRLPWHDIHMAVTGDIVKDLTKHFYDRWTHALFTDKCTFLRGNPAADKHANLNLLELVKVATKETERGPYNSQLLLSFGETEKNAEKSIQKAYLTTIALAKQFIYIESQFLIGGSMMWEDPNEYGNNQIPVQILLRIEEAIRYKQQFKVYVVIPLFPDNQKFMPHVMYNQFQTIKMMYRVIGLMIKKHRGTDSNAPKPDDYLFIGCLGKSEVNKKDNNKAEHNQIYVHSKMMIIDDRFIIAGSANLNERSMNGAMDAEICVSLWNKNHTGSNMAVIQAEESHDAELGTEPQEEKVQPEEEPVAENEPVKLFRKRIWKEVFGDEITKYDPQSTKCMELVKALAAANRKHFLKKEPLESGHIMRAPFTVDSNGTAKSEKVGINYINEVSGQEYLKGLDFAGTKAYTFTLQFL